MQNTKTNDKQQEQQKKVSSSKPKDTQLVKSRKKKKKQLSKLISPVQTKRILDKGFKSMNSINSLTSFTSDKGELQKPPICTIKNCVVLTLCVIIFFIVLQTWKKHSKIIFKALKNKLEKLTGMYYPYNYFVITFIYFLYLTFCIPGMSVFTILLALVMNSILKPFIMLMIAHFFAATTIYFTVKNCCQSYFRQNFRYNMIYQFVMQESKKSPIAISLLIRWISIQPTIKNTFCALGNIPYLIYILTLYPNSAFHGFIYCYVGINLMYIDELFIPKKFSSLNRQQKLSMLLSYLTLMISIAVILFVCLYTRNRLKVFRREFEAKMKKRKQEKRKILIERMKKKMMRDRAQKALKMKVSLSKGSSQDNEEEEGNTHVVERKLKKDDQIEDIMKTRNLNIDRILRKRTTLEEECEKIENTEKKSPPTDEGAKEVNLGGEALQTEERFILEENDSNPDEELNLTKRPMKEQSPELGLKTEVSNKSSFSKESESISKVFTYKQEELDEEGSPTRADSKASAASKVENAAQPRQPSQRINSHMLLSPEAKRNDLETINEVYPSEENSSIPNIAHEVKRMSSEAEPIMASKSSLSQLQVVKKRRVDRLQESDSPSMEKFEGIESEECRTPVKPTLPSKNLKRLGLLSTEKRRREKGENKLCFSNHKN